MKMEHAAIWAKDLEALKDFYVGWFEASANAPYENTSRGFRSYFLSFSSGARLELMQMPGIADPGLSGPQRFGLAHLAFRVDGGRAEVISLTEQLRAAGLPVVSEPRQTGDGYFESCVLDPEGNRIEITA